MRMRMKLAIVSAGFQNQQVAIKANRYLRGTKPLSELDISKIIHGRKSPTPEQAKALGLVLNVDPAELLRMEVGGE